MVKAVRSGILKAAVRPFAAAVLAGVVGLAAVPAQAAFVSSAFAALNGNIGIVSNDSNDIRVVFSSVPDPTPGAQLEFAGGPDALAELGLPDVPATEVAITGQIESLGWFPFAQTETFAGDPAESIARGRLLGSLEVHNVSHLNGPARTVTFSAYVQWTLSAIIETLDASQDHAFASSSLCILERGSDLGCHILDVGTSLDSTAEGSGYFESIMSSDFGFIDMMLGDGESVLLDLIVDIEARSSTIRPAVVPAPAGVALFGLGVLLVALRRRVTAA